MNIATQPILIVEDDLTHLMYLSALLRKRGYLVRGAHDGEEALDLLQYGKFGMVFMDVILPKMDGIDTCTVIRTNMHLHDLPVVMVSAGMIGDMLPSEPAGMITGFLEKPIAEPQLDAMLERVHA